MKDTQAYDANAPRRPVAIALRGAVDWSFRAVRHLVRAAGATGPVRTVGFWPDIPDSATLADLANRASWYLPDRNIRVLAVAGATLHDRHAAASEVPAAQEDYLSDSPERVTFCAREELLGNSDRLLVWRAGAAIPRLAALARIEIVDPLYYSTAECVAWSRLLADSMDSASAGEAESRWSANFARLRAELGTVRQLNVITTGPSSDRAHLVTFPADSVTILCNSAVRNEELLAASQPRIICFADPVFHFSPCRYAAAFRERAVAALRRFDAYCVVPARQAELVAAHYPDLRPRIIGLTLSSDKAWRVPGERELTVRGTGNILTQFMLPLAMALGSSVSIVGADGRDKRETYFWQHSVKNQFAGLMQTVVETHPSFFRDRLYEEYYARHCAALRSQVEFAESRGMTVHSLSPSFIPALAARFQANAVWPRAGSLS